MRYILTSCILLLGFTLPATAHQPKVYAKLSVYDCLTCTNNLGRVVSNCPAVSIVLDAGNLSDSTGILDKFNLRPYAASIVWDKELYDKLSKADVSEVIQFCDGRETNRVLLKRAGDFRPQPCNDAGVNSSAPAATTSGCSYTTPQQLKLRDFPACTILENYITDEKMVLYKSRQQLLKIQPSDSIIRQAYIRRFGDEQQFNAYADVCRTDTRLRPKVTAATCSDDSMLVYCIMTHYIDRVSAGDTSYDKMFTIVSTGAHGIASIDPVFSSHVSATHAIDEYEMFTYNGKLYFTIVGNPRVLARNDLKVLASFVKERKGYQLERVHDLLLNDYSINYNIFYNYSSVRRSHQYLGFTLADYVVDLKTGQKVPIPFEQSVFEGNKRIATGSAYYLLNDLKYNPSTNTLTLFYQLDGVKYVSEFKPGATKLLRTIRLFPLSYYTDYVKNVSLSDDGSRLVFIRKGRNCVEYCNIEDGPRIIAGLP